MSDCSVEPWPFAGEAGPFIGFLDECLRGPAKRRLGPLAERLVALATEVSPEVLGSDADARLVHGDYNATNLLIADDEVAAVLDWEWAHVGSPMMDLANILRDRESYLPEFIEGVLDGFDDSAPTGLPADWDDKTRMVDVLSAVEFLNSEGDKPQRHSSSLRIVEETLSWFAY